MKTMSTHSAFRVFVFLLTATFLSSGSPLRGDRNGRPWWDGPLRIIQDPLRDVVSHHGDVWMGGGGEDPFKGLYLQRRSTIHADTFIKPSEKAGIKRIVWYEGFGTAHSYVGELKKNADGSWVKNATDPTWTQLFCSYGNWRDFKGEGVIRWTGITNHFEDDPALRPWTRSHPEYGCPPMTYPDGAVATGFIGTESTDWDVLFGPDVDQRTSRIFDAGCSKDVFGNVYFEYGYNAAVNKVDPQTRRLVGPLTGLIPIEDAPIGTPDPGFTLEEWKKAKSAGYAGDIYCGKDIACPVWIDYLDASIRHAIEKADIDGLWVDNFSPWDNFNSYPIQRAFGEWTVAGFRTFLTGPWSSKIPEDLRARIDPNAFDVRTYLLARFRAWGGQGDSLKTAMRDRAWKDPRWQDDPIWRAFLVYKRRIGTAGLDRFYETVKRRGREAGKDILVTGNDMPMFSLGWVRGNLDMVSTELSWGWGNTSGSRGLMPPPHGCYPAVYRLAREHAKSRFVNIWMYVPKEHLGKPNLGNVLHYQGLANHTMPKAQLTPRDYGLTAGTPAATAEFYAFVESIEPYLLEREPIQGKIGVYYSSSSQLFSIAPGSFYDHANQEHSFSWFGWGTALVKKQIPWRPVPEWQLTPETLKKLKVLVLPNVITLGDAELEQLADWVRSGGRVILSGQFAVRGGEEENFEKRSKRSDEFLRRCDLAIRENGVKAFGKGHILGSSDEPGFRYYKDDQKRAETMPEIVRLLDRIAKTGDSILPDYVSVPKDFPFGVDVTLYRDPKRLFVDLNNTQIDLRSDAITPSGPLRFEILVPKTWSGKEIGATVLGPHEKPDVSVRPGADGKLALEVGSFSFYITVILEPK